jgi:3-isopropylmalate dehydrogenase
MAYACAVSYQVGVVGGDGIGPEVVSHALRVVEATGVGLSTQFFDLGGERYLRDETVLPDEILHEWRGLDALFFGAVGAPGVPPGVIERGLLLRMRFALDLYINLRPFRIASNQLGHAVDIVCIRENTEGSYAGEGGFLRHGTPHEIATQGSVNTRFGVERCIRFAFGLAATRPRQKLTLIHKTNVLTFAGDLWQRTFDEVAAEYPNIKTDYCHIDAACIHLVNDPERFDVIVTDNLFGDIITDLAGAIGGGIGLAASANLNPDRTGPSMFEPVHGSAPDIAGTGRANPIAAISSAALMLDYLGETKAAQQITDAVDATIDSSTQRMPTLSTTEIADLVLERL